MRRHRFVPLIVLAAFLSGTAPAGAGLIVSYTTDLVSAATIATPLTPGDGIYAQSSVRSGPGAFSQTIGFSVGAGVQGLAASLRWAVADTVRLVGVNLDLRDSAGDGAGIRYLPGPARWLRILDPWLPPFPRRAIIP